MISRIEGTLIEKHPPRIVIDVGGLGYELELPMSSFYELPAIGLKVVLRTHLVIREDAHLLFGFASEKERSVFRELIRVSGIGSKVALSILSAMSVDEFVACVRAQDVSSLTRVPGIGKKTAERLVLEMRDRLRSDPASPAHPDQADASFGAVPANARGEAAHALIALGYKAAEAESMINRIYHDTLSVEELIRKALQSSVKR